jgi:hypothetical protein
MMSSASLDPPAIPANDASADVPAAPAAAVSRVPRLPRERTRREGGSCGNCGFEDTGHYCSRCGEPLHGTQDTVLEILWSDMVEGPLHNLFALGKTTWLILAHPRHFFSGVLKKQRGLTSFPFFLAPAWRRVSHKPHGVLNAVKYFVLIYTLAIVGGWAFGVDMFPTVHVPLGGHDRVLPGLVSEPLILVLVVVAASMYAAAVSRLLGGKIDTEVLTKFMLYLNGFALIPLVGMAVTGDTHLKLFFGFLGFWLYALFAVPQLALPRLFGVSRVRLGFAQAGAAVANGVIIVGMLWIAAVAVELVAPGWMEQNARVASTGERFDPATPVSAVQVIRQSTVFPVDTIIGLLSRPGRHDPVAARGSAAFHRSGAAAAPADGAADLLFPLDSLGALVRFRGDAVPTEARHARHGRLRGSRAP